MGRPDPRYLRDPLARLGHLRPLCGLTSPFSTLCVLCNYISIRQAFAARSFRASAALSFSLLGSAERGWEMGLRIRSVSFLSYSNPANLSMLSRVVAAMLGLFPIVLQVQESYDLYEGPTREGNVVSRPAGTSKSSNLVFLRHLVVPVARSLVRADVAPRDLSFVGLVVPFFLCRALLDVERRLEVDRDVQHDGDELGQGVQDVEDGFARGRERVGRVGIADEFVDARDELRRSSRGRHEVWSPCRGYAKCRLTRQVAIAPRYPVRRKSETPVACP